MDEQHRRVGGLDTCLISSERTPPVLVVLLHGYGMRAADLTPFAHSLSIPGTGYAFPDGPFRTAGGGYAWWPQAVDGAAGAGPRDLADLDPPDRHIARRHLTDLLDELAAEAPAQAVLLGGFSQGGMLACDTLLFEPVRANGLLMLSASCLALEHWRLRAERLHGLRAFVSHGRADDDLAFSAGERLERFLSGAGARVTWVPFPDGHIIPLHVWRQVRTFIHSALPSAATPHARKPRYATH